MHLTQSDPVLAMQFIPKESDTMTSTISGNRRYDFQFSMTFTLPDRDFVSFWGDRWGNKTSSLLREL